MPNKGTKRKANQTNKENESNKRANNAEPTQSKKAKRVHSIREQIEPLKELLLNAKTPGSPYSGGIAKELPSVAGIYVKDFGLISLPLSSPQAEELIKKCSLTPCGEFILIFNKNKPKKIN
jgi:hypothetical protein